MRNAVLLLGLVLSAFPAAGCRVDEEGEFESVGLTTGTTGSSATGTTTDPFPPQDALCEYEAKPCTKDKDCCETELPDSLILGACPGPNYPNNWECEDDVCVNHGCNYDTDCIVEDFTCENVNGSSTAQCVGGCEDDDDCSDVYNMQDSKCLQFGDDDFKICAQEQPT